MIAWEKISEKLGDWGSYFKPFYDLGGFEAIYSKLKEEGKNIKILPEGKDLFKAFELCPAKELKTIWLGMSPYFMIKRGIIVADGLAFSCGHTKEEQPSLKLIFDALEDDLFDGINLNMLREPNLEFLAKQGVLLLNSMLTTTEGSADAHKELWKPFMDYFFKEVLLHFTGIPVVFFGKLAQEYSSLINEKSNYKKLVEHPSFSARQNRPFNHEKLFSWTNNILKQRDQEIDWTNLPF
jgi:uracil-DNA glycosylase